MVAVTEVETQVRVTTDAQAVLAVAQEYIVGEQVEVLLIKEILEVLRGMETQGVKGTPAAHTMAVVVAVQIKVGTLEEAVLVVMVAQVRVYLISVLLVVVGTFLAVVVLGIPVMALIMDRGLEV
jgi:hypothetical protein